MILMILNIILNVLLIVSKKTKGRARGALR